MRFVGNTIWFVLVGWLTSAIWLIGAFIFAISIVGLPFSRAALELAKLSAFPFGKDVVYVRDLDQIEPTTHRLLIGTVGTVMNFLWLFTFGIVLFCVYLIIGLSFWITIVGIPLGLQAFKLAALALFPIGRRVVSIETANIIRGEKASLELNRARQ